MTLDEAQKVADIVQNADGGCPVCVGHLVDELGRVFPDFVWIYDRNDDSYYSDHAVQVKENECSDPSATAS